MIFRYFIPNARAADITPVLIDALGLRRVFDDDGRGTIAAAVVAETKKGPAGGGGVMLTARQESDRPWPRIGYYPDEDGKRDLWLPVDRPVENSDSVGATSDATTGRAPLAESGYFIGYEPEHLPVARTLRRPRQLDGYEEVLGDGGEWLCPRVRQYDQVMLPQTFLRFGRGELHGEVLPAYRQADSVGFALMRHLTLCDEVWDNVWQWNARNLDNSTAYACAITLLSANYRIDTTEASILKLLDTQTIPKILDVAVDERWRIEAMAETKKKEEICFLRNALARLFSGQDTEETTDQQSQITSSSDSDTANPNPE